MTKLIVAIDTFEALDLIPSLSYLGIKIFKFHHLIPPELNFKLKELNCDWFYDRKLYDTKDAVTNICTTAFKLGADFITVYANPIMLKAAMQAKFTPYQKILAVGSLTDDSNYIGINGVSIKAISICDGLICSVPSSISWYRDLLKIENKIFICPGIRPLGSDSHNHSYPNTPTQAKSFGADYIVIGRPITLAPDPIHVAKLILDEIKD